MTAHETLVGFKDFFEWVEQTQECPDGSENRVQEIWGAFKKLNPDYHIDWCCGSCVFRMIKQADNIRKEYLKSQPVNYTFPKHEKE